MIKLISLKTYLSRRRMRLKLRKQMRNIKEVINEMTLCRERFLKAERIGSKEQGYYKGWFECLKWVIGEE